MLGFMYSFSLVYGKLEELKVICRIPLLFLSHKSHSELGKKGYINSTTVHVVIEMSFFHHTATLRGRVKKWEGRGLMGLVGSGDPEKGKSFEMYIKIYQ